MDPPDLSQPLPPPVRLSDALVVPPLGAPVGPAVDGRSATGVLDARGAWVPESVHWRDGHPFTAAPPRVAAQDTLPGTWIYLGLAFGHFGHSLTESIARLWTRAAVDGPVDGFLLTPRMHPYGGGLPGWATNRQDLLAALGVDRPVRIVLTPTRVETLVVGHQGLGLGDWATGAPQMQAWIRDRFGHGIAPGPDDRLYVSRSRVKPGQGGGLLGEDRIEARLAADGYRIFHPQEHDLPAQIAAYRGASRVVAVEGSALHLLAMASRPGQSVAILARRPGADAQMFARQIRAFGGADATVVDALRRHWLLAGHRRPGPKSQGEADLGRIGAALAAGGFIRDGAWPDLDDAGRRDALDRLHAACGHPLDAWTGTDGPPVRPPRPAAIARRAPRAAPVNAAPVNAVPVQAAPVHAAPVQAAPVRAAPPTARAPREAVDG